MMMKKLITLIAAAMLTLSVAGTASAAFVTGDLIRVVYDTVGSKEIATDLGSWSSVLGSAANTRLGSGIDAFTLSQFGPTTTYADLKVGYFMVDPTTGANQVAIAGDANGIISRARAFSSYVSNSTQTMSWYQATSTTASTVVMADKTAGNTFFNRMQAAEIIPGGYGGWTTAAGNPGGVPSLADLATTGYIDQTVYYWSGVNLAGVSTGLAGAAKFTLRTMADGSTVINPGSLATPIPPAFLLMGSGLLGMVGIRRKMAA